MQNMISELARQTGASYETTETLVSMCLERMQRWGVTANDLSVDLVKAAVIDSNDAIQKMGTQCLMNPNLAAQAVSDRIT